MRHLTTSILLMAALSGAACSRDDDVAHGEPDRVSARLNDLQPLGTVEGFGLSGDKLTVDLSAPLRGDLYGTTNCHAYLPDDFVLGQATCHGRPELTATVLASQAVQACKDDPAAAPTLQPVVGIFVPGCEGSTYDLAAYRLDPDLRVTLEP